MTLRERQFRSPDSYLTIVLQRLHRASIVRYRASAFQDLCDAASIPRDLRANLLRTLVSQGYATDEGHGLIRITALGSQVAVTPHP